MPAAKLHSSTPWSAVKARTLLHITNGHSPICEISISANHIHEDRPGCKAEFIARQEANAALIVLAVNSHEALARVLETAIETLERYQTSDCEGESYNNHDVILTLGKCRAALELTRTPK